MENPIEYLSPEQRWQDYRDRVLRPAGVLCETHETGFKLAFFAGMFAFDFVLQEVEILAGLGREEEASAHLGKFHADLQINIHEKLTEAKNRVQ
jgi:hypothetical protein